MFFEPEVTRPRGHFGSVLFLQFPQAGCSQPVTAAKML